jgi:hypothetical protein
MVVMETDTTSSSKSVVWGDPDGTPDYTVRRVGTIFIILVMTTIAVMCLLWPDYFLAHHPPSRPDANDGIDGRACWAVNEFILAAWLFFHVLLSRFFLNGFRANADGMQVAYSYASKLVGRYVNKKILVRWCNVTSIGVAKLNTEDGSDFWVAIMLKEPLASGDKEIHLSCSSANEAQSQCQELRQLAAGQLATAAAS